MQLKKEALRIMITVDAQMPLFSVHNSILILHMDRPVLSVCLSIRIPLPADPEDRLLK
jgi:hypothetical protein